MNDSSISSSLLDRLRTNDCEAWRRLLALYGPLVYKRCRRRGIPRENVGDVGQEVFSCVAAGLADFRRERPGDSFRGWLSVILARRIADYHRRRQQLIEGEALGGSEARRHLAEVPARESSPPADSDGAAGAATPEDTAEPGEAAELRRRALKLLRLEFKPSTWQACWLVVIQRMPVEEAATQLGLSANAVRIARGRVLKRLREQFGDLLH
jgi:RNA polymerase sigma-70 factor, ECF subfamily